MSSRPDDTRNREGLNYWEKSWPENGVQSFSPHTRFVEASKWSYLREDLRSNGGLSLEVGSGSGHFSALLAQEGFRAFLLDYSFSAVVCARNSFRHYSGQARKHYVGGDALALPFPKNTFDLVLSCGVLEHFENPSVPINEMSRVLKAGGLFYADICPKKFSLINMVSALHRSDEGWYEKRMKQKEIKKIIADSGLRLKRIFAAGVLPPRDFPGKGLFPSLRQAEAQAIDKSAGFWRRFDGTMLAELFGFYYYVTAVKK